MSKALRIFLKGMGTRHIVTPAYSPEFNGFEERMHRILGEMSHAMRSYAELPATFWGLT